MTNSILRCESVELELCNTHQLARPSTTQLHLHIPRSPWRSRRLRLRAMRSAHVIG